MRPLGAAAGARRRLGRVVMARIAAPAGQSQVEPGPLPCDEGLPEWGEAWAPGGAPPAGLEFIGARPTLRGWMLPCPACLVGWVPIVPDGTRFGYRVAVELGCIDVSDGLDRPGGCEAPDVAWWHSWRMGVLPPREPPGDRQRRYAYAAVRNALDDVLQGKDPIGRARDAGRFAEAAGFDLQSLAAAFARAGKVQLQDVLPSLLVGAATPARLPDGR